MPETFKGVLRVLGGIAYPQSAGYLKWGLFPRPPGPPSWRHLKFARKRNTFAYPGKFLVAGSGTTRDERPVVTTESSTRIIGTAPSNAVHYPVNHRIKQDTRSPAVAL
jgi:hypothetical protein